MGILQHRLKESPEKILAVNSQQLVDNSTEVLQAIANIPPTDLTEIIELLNTLKSKEVDLSSLVQMIREIPKTDLTPVLDAVSSMPSADLMPLIGSVKSLEKKVQDIAKELRKTQKKREFRFDIEREEFSDLAHTIKATEL